MIVKPYLSQVDLWPQTGCHILAQFDQDSIIVYQAYNTAIGHFAATHGYFGGDFSFQLTSWIKTSFLWIMYRSGWGTKKNQEVILAVRLKHSGFEAILNEAIHTYFVPEVYATEEEWKAALKHSSVVLQWDPDRDPAGAKVSHRALQLGLRGSTLEHYAHDWIVGIEDISEFVRRQFAHVDTNTWSDLFIPYQMIYTSVRSDIAARLGIMRTDVDPAQ